MKVLQIGSVILVTAFLAACQHTPFTEQDALAAIQQDSALHRVLAPDSESVAH